MAKKIRVKLTGEAEKVVNNLLQQGLTEEEIIAKGLTLLAMAQQSRLAEVEGDKVLGTLKVIE